MLDFRSKIPHVSSSRQLDIFPYCLSKSSFCLRKNLLSWPCQEMDDFFGQQQSSKRKLTLGNNSEQSVHFISAFSIFIHVDKMQIFSTIVNKTKSFNSDTNPQIALVKKSATKRHGKSWSHYNLPACFLFNLWAVTTYLSVKTFISLVSASRFDKKTKRKSKSLF